jgi:hypothetical protein
MKIAIIGAGWVGCHLALKLSDHEISLYESDGIFSQASYKNQNRLHLGYHYARSFSTRKLCVETFEKFITDYPSLVEEVQENLYVIPNDKSIVDFETYSKIFDDYDHDIVSVNYLNNIDGAIRVKEMFINPFKAKKYFTELLGEKVVYKIITSKDLDKISNENDLVINCTNNALNSILEDVKFEPCEVLVYEKIKDIPFGALTFVDGDLFSIYPYQDKLFTVTQVSITPDKNMDTESKKENISNNISKYYKSFNKDFKYHHSYKSNKVKYINGSDSRVPRMHFNGNIITIYTGKIQGIYNVEEYVKQKIEEISND